MIFLDHHLIKWKHCLKLNSETNYSLNSIWMCLVNCINYLRLYNPVLQCTRLWFTDSQTLIYTGIDASKVSIISKYQIWCRAGINSRSPMGKQNQTYLALERGNIFTDWLTLPIIKNVPSALLGLPFTWQNHPKFTKVAWKCNHWNLAEQENRSLSQSQYLAVQDHLAAQIYCPYSQYLWAWSDKYCKLEINIWTERWPEHWEVAIWAMLPKW